MSVRSGDGTGGVDRRRFLRLMGLGSLGSVFVGCAAAPAAVAPAGTGAAPKAAWELEWERVLAAAKQEGAVAVVGPPGDDYRGALAAFEKAYPDIRLDYLGVSGRDVEAKLIAERDAGQYLVDVHVGGSTTAFSLKPHGVFAPLRPALILPDASDDSKWRWGFDSAFLDND